MERAHTRLSVCPIRSRPEDASEMISQLLFGEQVEILERRKPSWVRIRCVHDGYEGWMDEKQINTAKMPLATPAVSLEVVDSVFSEGATTYVTLGAELPGFDGMTATLNGRVYRFSGQALMQQDVTEPIVLVEKLARKLLNTPYLWGGRSPFGIDCSGLTQLVYKCAGMSLPRDSRDQAACGEVVDFLAQSRTGDLAFFSKSTAEVTHVGIVLEDTRIIHASGSVRIDALDHYGIYNRDIEEYTHRLKIIKRVC